MAGMNTTLNHQQIVTLFQDSLIAKIETRLGRDMTPEERAGIRRFKSGMMLEAVEMEFDALELSEVGGWVSRLCVYA